jgi:ring-1,2-phenylacetyl-CoA epoxidase subunit PaaC
MEYTEKHVLALKELLYKMADDQLILGHRNSEWTGLGPVLEEDIAFSSMAQDKLGQSHALYQLLHELGEGEPDTVAFMRNSDQFHCCHLTELPIGEYDFSLIRHFLFDRAEQLRFDMLASSSYEPLAQVARKFRGEIKYHVMHADVWIKQLGKGNEESHARMQEALKSTFPLALGIFEPGPYEADLAEAGIFAGELALRQRWLESIRPVLEAANLHLPDAYDDTTAFGGRYGRHTEYLQPLLDEMTEVFRIDPAAEW